MRLLEKIIIKVLWIIECIIAVPAVVCGFLYQSFTMGFISGKDLAETVFINRNLED